MIAKIFRTIIKNAQLFFVVWAVVILANQIFIFGACFAPYCLIAALPHTFVMSAIGMYFYIETNKGEEYELPELTDKEVEEFLSRPPIKKLSKNEEATEGKLCPKCGSNMRIRVARNGKYAGRSFWGCSKYPDCHGIINIEQ